VAVSCDIQRCERIWVIVGRAFGSMEIILETRSIASGSMFQFSSVLARWGSVKIALCWRDRAFRKGISHVIIKKSKTPQAKISTGGPSYLLGYRIRSFLATSGAMYWRVPVKDFGSEQCSPSKTL